MPEVPLKAQNEHLPMPKRTVGIHCTAVQILGYKSIEMGPKRQTMLDWS